MNEKQSAVVRNSGQVIGSLEAAKKELMRALRVAEDAGLQPRAALDRLCGQVETLQRRVLKQQQAAHAATFK